MKVLILTTNHTQDYAVDALAQGLRDHLGADNVWWNPHKAHLGTAAPSPLAV